MHEKYFQSCPMPFEPWDAVRVFVSSPFGVCCSRFCPGLSISDACLAPVGVSMSRLGTSLSMLGTPLTLPSPCRLLWLLQGGWVFPPPSSWCRDHSPDLLALCGPGFSLCSQQCPLRGPKPAVFDTSHSCSDCPPVLNSLAVLLAGWGVSSTRLLLSFPLSDPLPTAAPAWVGRAQLLSSIGVQSRWPSLERVPALNPPGA